MKKVFTLVLITLFIGIAVTFTATTVHAVPVAGTECDDPTTEVTIRAQTGIQFEKNKIEVPRATCVKITLINEDADLNHDFTINGKTGDNGIEEVYILVNGGETNSFNVTTPDADVTFDFYCSVPGHRSSGMEGSFVVGEGSSEDDSPGFSVWLSFTAFLASVILIRRIRK
ncbi:MAG: hypothetical protein GPJ54_03860 [Candidatus Heimdallarchaeota archaeon]|nr:hypothetical protein [Candidatus Heimdallarchaeota archaeon]